jgi:hypothetical protein
VRDSAIAGHVIWTRGVLYYSPTVLATSSSIRLGKELNCALFWVGIVLLGGGQVLALHGDVVCVVTGSVCKYIVVPACQGCSQAWHAVGADIVCCRWCCSGGLGGFTLQSGVWCDGGGALKERGSAGSLQTAAMVLCCTGFKAGAQWLHDVPFCATGCLALLVLVVRP